MKRCEECGSWEAQCGSPAPINDCACARCANARVEALEARLRDALTKIEFCESQINLCHECRKKVPGSEG